MKVVRKIEIDTNDIKISDRIQVQLTGLGEFTATAHKITDKGVLFIFDDVICERPMNEENTNEGGYELSDLKRWIDDELYNTFPNELKNRIAGLSIPTYGMLFGHDFDEWDNEHFESDEDDQLELMKNRKNRIAFYNDNLKWYWLRNTMKKEYSATGFADVNGHGIALSCSASSAPLGVRPMFILEKEVI